MARRNKSEAINITNETQMDTFKHTEMPMDEKNISYYIKRVLTSPFYILVLLGVIGLFLLFRNVPVTIPAFYLMMLAIIVAFIVYNSFTWLAKHQSPKAIFNQYFTTVLPEVTTTVGMFDVWAAGSIYVNWWYPVLGKEATIIVPKDARNKIGRCYVYPTRLWYYSYDLLPSYLKKAIDQFHCNKEKILLGLVDDSQAEQMLSPEGLKRLKEFGLDSKVISELTRMNKVPISVLEELILKEFSRANAFETQLNATSESLEKVASRIRRYGDLKEPHAAQKAINWVRGKDEE